MTMIAPCDANECVKMLEASITYPGPIYIRIPRGEEPAVYPDQNFDYEIGKAITLKEGNDVTIIATGSEVHFSIEAARILQKEGIDVGVIDMHTN